MEASEARYQVPAIARSDRPVRLGSLLITLVEPRRGHEVAYNRWYERDHFYAGCMIGPWQFAGARYVATRDCKALRYPAESSLMSDVTKGSYLALYWVLDEHHDDWNAWAVEQVNRLHADSRMFTERDHIHTGLYRYAGEMNAAGSTTPAELALDRAYPGIVVVIGETTPGVTVDRLDGFFRERPCPADLMVMGTPLPLSGNRPSDVPEAASSGRFVQIYFSTEDPRSEWVDRFAGIGDALAASRLGRVLFASPFLATIPGTDTYTDQLW